MYGVLEDAGFEITGINTDSLFVAHSQRSKLAKFKKENSTYFDKTESLESIGKWKTEKKYCRKRLVQRRKNALFVPQGSDKEVKVFKIAEEKDWETSGVFLKKVRRLLARQNLMLVARYPGCGKSFICIDFAGRRKHIVVHAFNHQKEKLMKESGLNVITTCELLGLGIDDRHTGTAIDVEGIELIVFDEILLNNRAKLWRIFQFMKAHPNIRFLATGDLMQIRAVEDHELLRSNLECLEMMFPKQLELEIIKRVKDGMDIEGYKTMLDHLFVKGWSPRRIVKEFSHFFGEPVLCLEKVETTTNLSYTNATRRIVDHHVFSSVLKKEKILPGQEMVCKAYVKGEVSRNHDKSKKKALCVNRTYVVKNVEETIVTLQDPDKTNELIRVERRTFDRDFELPYCATIHSVIGLTLDEPVTLFDWNEYNVSREWFWTAITRTTSLKSIHLYQGPPISNTDLKKAIRRKLGGHLKSDQRSGIYDAKNFVTVEWTLKEMDRVQWRCAERGCEIDRNPGSHHQWSIDRIDNSFGHVMNNCRIICLSCNNAKH
jgi:hypothetical protein